MAWIKRYNVLMTINEDSELQYVKGFEGLRVRSEDSGNTWYWDKATHDFVAENTGGDSDITAAQVKSLYESNNNTNAFTDGEKDKLSGLEGSKFLGMYTTFSELEAIPGEEGQYAYVDGGEGSDVKNYIWDNTDLKWVEQGGATTAETPSSIKAKYESNADTNVFTDAEKSKLSNLKTTTTWSDVSGKPSTFAPIIGTTSTTAMAGNTALFSGNYDDLAGRPDLTVYIPKIQEPTADSIVIANGDGTISGSGVKINDLFSGNYEDLTNTPTIPSIDNLVPETRTVNGQPLSSNVSLTASDVGAATSAQGTLATTALQPDDVQLVATTGKYSDLTEKAPSLTEQEATAGTATTAKLIAPDVLKAAIEALAPTQTATAWGDITGKPAVIAAGATAAAARTAIGAGTSDFDGDYESLTNQPTIPDLTNYYDKSTTDGLLNDKANAIDVYTQSQVDSALDDKVDKVSGKVLSDNNYTTAEKNKLAGLNAANYATTAQGELADTAVQPGALSAVATSGSYNDLDNVPTDLISGVNVGKITLGTEPATPADNDIWIDTDTNPAAPVMNIRIGGAWAALVGGA